MKGIENCDIMRKNVLQVCIMKKEIKNFLSANYVWWVILTALLAVLSIVFIVSAIKGNDVEPMGAVVFFGGLALSLIPHFNNKKFYDNIEKEGLAPQIEVDFQNAVPKRKGRVRLGDKWIFVKGKERLLQYGDICQVYQSIHKKNFVENRRCLKYKDTKGRTHVLCKLELRGKSDAEMIEIFIAIRTKNPNVKIGYR